jgi:hypothetical protein
VKVLEKRKRSVAYQEVSVLLYIGTEPGSHHSLCCGRQPLCSMIGLAACLQVHSDFEIADSHAEVA